MTQRALIITASLLILLLSIIGVFFYHLLKSHNEWKAKVRSSPGDRMFKTKQHFIQFFLNKGYSTKSVEFIYEQTKKFLKAKDLVLLPNDDLINLYEREEVEWFHIIDKWFKKLGQQKPDKNRLAALRSKYQKISFEYLIELVEK